MTPKPTIRHYIELVLLHLFLAVMRLLGLERASRFGGWLGRSIGPRITGLTRRARRRLHHFLPDKSDEEIDQIIVDMWDNLGRTAAEYAHLDRFADPAENRVIVVGMEHAEAAMAQDKGVIFLSGHFANWEVTTMSLAPWRDRLGQVYRAANNPLVDEVIAKLRATHVAPIQMPKGVAGARAMLKLIRNKGAIAMLIDQKMNEGIAVPLLGKAAMSAPAAAEFARRLGCPLVPASIERLADEDGKGPRFRIMLYPPFQVEKTDDKEADVLHAMTRVNDFLGEQILARPHEWLWLHNRWPDI